MWFFLFLSICQYWNGSSLYWSIGYQNDYDSIFYHWLVLFCWAIWMNSARFQVPHKYLNEHFIIFIVLWAQGPFIYKRMCTTITISITPQQIYSRTSNKIRNDFFVLHWIDKYLFDFDSLWMNGDEFAALNFDFQNSFSNG